MSEFSLHTAIALAVIGLAVIGLVTLNALSYYSQRLRFLAPIIWVLLIGFAYSVVARFTDIGVPELPLDPEVILFAFVPLLIFASTQKICLHHFKKVLAPASFIATVGILISMVIIALPLYFFVSFSVLEALLFGVILSATDPLAVGALLAGNKDVPESQKLLIEGESILNDGFVVTVAGIIAMMLFGGEEFNLIHSGLDFLKHIVGALVLGTVIGRGGRWLLDGWMEEHFTLTVNMTLAVAYGSFALGEMFHLSGILAVFAAALAFGYKRTEEDHQKHVHRHLWEYLEYVSNAVLFFLLGASFFVYFSLEEFSLGMFSLVILFLLLPRLLSLAALLPFLKLEGEKLGKRELLLLNFAGARGAVSIALILLLPADFHLKQTFLAMAFVLIFLSLLIYPVCLGQVLKKS